MLQSTQCPSSQQSHHQNRGGASRLGARVQEATEPQGSTTAAAAAAAAAAACFQRTYPNVAKKTVTGSPPAAAAALALQRPVTSPTPASNTTSPAGAAAPSYRVSGGLSAQQMHKSRFKRLQQLQQASGTLKPDDGGGEGGLCETPTQQQGWGAAAGDAGRLGPGAIPGKGFDELKGTGWGPQVARSMELPSARGGTMRVSTAAGVLQGAGGGQSGEATGSLTQSVDGADALSMQGSRNSSSNSTNVCVLPKGWGGGKQAWGQQPASAASSVPGVPLFRARQWDSSNTHKRSVGPSESGDGEEEEGDPCFSYMGDGGSKRSGPLLRGSAPTQAPPSSAPAFSRDKGLGAVTQPPKIAPASSKVGTQAESLNGTSKGLFVDLIEATRKSFASGLGEWDLQAVEWGHPQFKQKLLKGPLGPESLKIRYGLKEADQLKLYRVLYSYTVGFCDAVDEPTGRAQHREELLELVFKAYAQLWDEALGIAFSSEMVNTFHTKNGALSSVADLQAQLQAAQAEKGQLQHELAQFARGNIDNMLVQRMDTDKARTTEGEVHMLARAADTLSLKLSGSEAKQEGLVLAAQEAHSRMEAAEAQARELMSQSAKLKAALKEQQAVSTRLAARVKELDQQLSVAMKDKARLTAELEVHRARVTPIERPKSELELALADKTRAYSLLHTDFVVKMTQLDEFRHQNRELQEKVNEIHATFDSASQRITLAQAEKEKYRHRWESNCMYTEDLEATNARMSLRNHELVRAYWPLMSHLREVEARCEALEAEQSKAQETKARLNEQVATQQEQLQRAALYKQRMRGLEATLAAAEAAGEVPASLLAELAPESAERLHAFVRGVNMRVESLTTQLVHLVDVHASSSADLQQYRVLNRELHRQVRSLDEQNKELEAHFMRQVTRVAAQAANEVAEELAALKNEDERMSRSQAQEEKAGAPATPVSYMAKIASLRVEMQELEERMDLVQRVRTVNENRIAVLEDERDAAMSECAGRDKWLYEVCNQAEALSEEVIRLLARDPNAPPQTSRFAPGAALAPKPPTPQPSSVPAMNSTVEGGVRREGSAGAVPCGGAQDIGKGGSQGAGASVQQPVGGAVGGLGTAHEEGEGGNKDQYSAKEGRSPSPSPGRGGKEGVMYKVPQLEHGSRAILLGRLAVRVGTPSETCRSLVAVDRCWESMASAVERMVAWGSGLVTQPVQIAQLQQLKTQAAALTAAKQKDQAEIQALTKRAEEAEQQLQAAQKRLEYLDHQIINITSTSETAQSGRAAFESALNGAREELEQLHARHTRMEREYWTVKAQLLDAELKGGEASSARERALADAQRAEERMQRAEKETAEHRYQRKQLEADVVGLKAWVRTMQGTERAHRELLVELAQSQDKLENANKATLALQERMSSQGNQLEAARHQVSMLAAQLQQSAALALDEQRGGAAADHAVKTAAAAQVARAEEGRGLAERRTAEAEDRLAAVRTRLAAMEAQLAATASEGSSLRQQLFASQQQVVRLQALLPRLTSGTQAIDRMVANMERRLGALGSQVTLMTSSLGDNRSQKPYAATSSDGADAGSVQQGSLLAACHALADCAEGMANSIARIHTSADSHCGAQKQIETLLRLEGLVNDLMGLLNSTTCPLPTSQLPAPSSPSLQAPTVPARRSPQRPKRPAGVVPSASGPPGSSWRAPAGKANTGEVEEEVPSLAASVVALQVSLAAAQAEAAEAVEAEHVQRAARVDLERQLTAATALVRQQRGKLEHLELQVHEGTQEVLALRSIVEAAAVTQKATEEAAAAAAAAKMRVEQEHGDALQQAMVARDALHAERAAVARLQRVCAEVTSATLPTHPWGAVSTAGGQQLDKSDLKQVDTVVELATARTERADALARLELAEKIAQTAVADAAAHAKAAQAAAETARNADVARLEMMSLLAEARRAHEAVQDKVRHAEAEAARMRDCMTEIEKDAARERERADKVCRSLLDIQVEMRMREGERALALSALVDESVAPSVRAAAMAAAKEAIAASKAVA